MDKQYQYKTEMFTALAQMAKGLASDSRLVILHLLFQAPSTVETLAKESGLSVANTSRHLQVLKQSNLVKSVKDGNYIIYSLANYKIYDLINLLIDIGEDEIADFKKAQNTANSEPGVKTISLADAKKIKAHSFMLDARTEHEYNEGHVDGAVNIPYTEIEEHLQELPKNQPIIVYCRGRLCPITNDVTKELNDNGFEAYSLNNTCRDWQELNC
ncbi:MULTISPECIES: metalloregulator ArsR/SmtB family transcription factor [Lactobacillus]|uniref:ArsR family transcriptional regulator n=1 Tax=Lactobacillus xujianguonis TaxID=2495899 RepID=A0A437SXI0_9LACO|nr:MULTISPECIES: metalloregulator ArsR/SmtB family transcription factor [Lactobacillus]RVU71517.1 ArsR family transcriptional regulator [Lactobacillus xujianguonis]RVU76704.1 ArsR family transcriptional regulator [Lactobacillus xujianguonis]